MKKINIEIRISETIDGYRLDINDYEKEQSVKLNPETKSEALAVTQRYLDAIMKEPLYETGV